MPMTQKELLRRVAGIPAGVIERRNSLERLRALLEPLERGGLLPVTGERSLLIELEDLLNSIQDLLVPLKTDVSPEAVEKIAAVMDDVGWSLVDEVVPDLEQKLRQQSELVRGFENTVAQWERFLVDLEPVTTGARSEGAPLLAEEAEYRRIEAHVSHARTALSERSYSSLPELLQRIPYDGAERQQFLESAREKAAQAREVARQADLLLLRSEGRDALDYTVLLRTPSLPGTHGINLQDSSSLVADDRQWMEDMMRQVVGAINAHQQRSFEWRVAAPGAPATRALSVDNPESAPAVDGNRLLSDVGDLLFRLVVPETMHSFFTTSRCSITITTNDLTLPWELMRYEGRVLCLDRPVARLPMGRAFPRQIDRKRMKAKKIRFLLIYADPDNNLASARREIEVIGEALAAEWKDRIEVTTLASERATNVELNEKLRSGSFDVIHYAGHAYFNSANADLSGLILHRRVPFYAQKIRRLLEGQPLVFLNACESGAVANETQPQRAEYLLQKPAAGLASSFVYGGALGCLGSLWSIYDDLAAQFAVRFYKHVLEGEMIGEALRLARRESREQNLDSITWATFVLYGDPTFRLVAG